MREVGSRDESYQRVGYLIIVVNHHRQNGMGDMGLLTCQMPAWTNIDNAKTSILQQYQRLFKLFKLLSLQSSLTEYQTWGNNNVKKSGLRNGVSGKRTANSKLPNVSMTYT